MMSFSYGIEPGLETREPDLAAERYESALQSHGETFQNKRVLVLGYGGYFGLCVSLLDRGAKHVLLLDPYADLKHRDNQNLVRSDSNYLTLKGNQTLPNPDWITILRMHVKDYVETDPIPVDLVISSSVYEHLPNPGRITTRLCRATAENGYHIHIIDLRDHYFKYPFEMLCYSRSTWERFLNPSSNLNRLRLWDYESIFKSQFRHVHVEVLSDDAEAFMRTKARIRPEFISGDEKMDSASKIQVFASKPIR
jgi:hypothetical protein